MSHLKNISEDLPDPIKNWIESIVYHTWDLILEGSYEHIYQLWKETIFKDFETQCLKKFPFDLQSKEEISLKDFTTFFAPKGRLTQFFNEYLQDFISINTWQWKEEKHRNIVNSDMFLKFFKEVFKIQNTYFENKASTPSISFTILPSSLSPNVSLVKLKLGDKIIEYRHEAPQRYSLTWPQDFKNKECSIEFYDFNGNQSKISAVGEWALLRLFQKGEISNTAKSENCFYKFKQKDFYATFEVIFFQNGDAFYLEEFQKIKLLNVN